MDPHDPYTPPDRPRGEDAVRSGLQGLVRRRRDPPPADRQAPAPFRAGHPAPGGALPRRGSLRRLEGRGALERARRGREEARHGRLHFRSRGGILRARRVEARADPLRRGAPGAAAHSPPGRAAPAGRADGCARLAARPASDDRGARRPSGSRAASGRPQPARAGRIRTRVASRHHDAHRRRRARGRRAPGIQALLLRPAGDAGSSRRDEGSGRLGPGAAPAGPAAGPGTVTISRRTRARRGSSRSTSDVRRRLARRGAGDCRDARGPRNPLPRGRRLAAAARQAGGLAARRRRGAVRAGGIRSLRMDFIASGRRPDRHPRHRRRRGRLPGSPVPSRT